MSLLNRRTLRSDPTKDYVDTEVATRQAASAKLTTIADTTPDVAGSRAANAALADLLADLAALGIVTDSTTA